MKTLTYTGLRRPTIADAGYCRGAIWSVLPWRIEFLVAPEGQRYISWR